MLAPRILHIETSSQACSVALSEGMQVLFAESRLEKNVHSSALVPMLDNALEQAGLTVGDLQAVAVSIGPGSYTGLRVGLSTAKGICYASGLPLIAVSTLQALAWTARDMTDGAPVRIIAALDARRQDAYIGVYSGAGKQLEEDQFVTATPELVAGWSPGQVLICGEGLEKWQEVSTGLDIGLLPLQCDAKYLISSALDAYEGGKYADLAACVPAYIKAPNITIPA